MGRGADAPCLAMQRAQHRGVPHPIRGRGGRGPAGGGERIGRGPVVSRTFGRSAIRVSA